MVAQRAEIRVLPPELIDQIAAGEVVERPASVVKELLENALDAGATQITVDIEGGGKRRIRVVDNGYGMDASQAELALVRHATSKLRSVEQLFGISTMGFRGEALASIASVSRMTLTTRARGGDMGAMQLRVEGGIVVEKEHVGAPQGTAIEVSNLFFNVPARCKFLKGDATESSHVTDVVTKVALAHPGVEVKLRHGGRATLHAPAHDSRAQRVQAVVGTKIKAALAEATGNERGVRVHAFLAAPELAQSTSRALQLFVGRRPVRDRGLVHAVSMGYGELVARGRYPVAVVYVDVPDPDLDVNVHPQKLEVRFADAQAVYAAVRHTVVRAAAEASWLQQAQLRSPGPVALRTWAPAAGSGPVRGARASELAENYARATTRTLVSMRSPRLGEQAPTAPRTAPVPTIEPSAASASEADGPDGFFGQLRYIGQLDLTYLVCEREGELVLLDQHAAHERVAFHRLKERYSERAMPVQRLLFPRTVDLDSAQAAVAGEAREELASMGFELEPFGGDTWAVKSVPADVREHQVEGVLRALLGELAAHEGSRAVDERIDNALATIACHSVVRAGDALGVAEAEALLSSLDGIDFRGFCPHGRPVLLRMSTSEIARRFGRTS